MLTDSWIIAQLISQVCSLALLGGALYHGTGILFKWDSRSNSDLQLTLERKTYLVSSIVQFVMVFQVAALVMFLNTVNSHLPAVIKGAMCATGVLGTNEYGYPTLYFKLVSVFVYVAYLFMNYLDEREPGYPLTPIKYWLLPFALLLVATDLAFMITYFVQIDPEVIATCCSVAFLARAKPNNFLDTGKLDTSIYIVWSAMGFAFLIGSLLIKKYRGIYSLFFSVLFVLGSVFALRYFFVKYIYGLPSHLCLFDIFFGQYFYIGYVIFGAYFFVISSALCLGILERFRFRLEKPTHNLSVFLLKTMLIAATCALMVPVAYWLAWSGEL